MFERYDPLRSANKARGPDDPNEALDDSKMIKSVAPLREGGPKTERLYIMTGYALMTFEDKVSTLESTVMIP